MLVKGLDSTVEFDGQTVTIIHTSRRLRGEPIRIPLHAITDVSFGGPHGLTPGHLSFTINGAPNNDNIRKDPHTVMFLHGHDGDIKPIHDAIQIARGAMTPPPPPPPPPARNPNWIRVGGISGTVEFDGEATITIIHKGAQSGLHGISGEYKFELGDIERIVYQKPAGFMSFGHMIFLGPGQRPRFDPHEERTGMMFAKGQTASFEQLRATLDAAFAARK